LRHSSNFEVIWVVIKHFLVLSKTS
jgi:hypothetical protein